MAHLIIDTANLVHRARSGFTLGEYPVIFNFFRGIKSLFKDMATTSATFVLEGSPRQRLEAHSEYKANRAIDPTDTKKLEEHAKFVRQRKKIEELLKCLRVTIARHPGYEADDVIAAIACKKAYDCTAECCSVIVVSTDTDFFQLPNKVSIYNPVKKAFVEPPVDRRLYAEYKSFTGDGSDNIPCVEGIKPKRAKTLTCNHDERKKFFAENPEAYDRWNKNLDLIKFHCVNMEEIEFSIASTPDYERLRSEFETMEFKSIVNDRSWPNFIAPFQKLIP